MRSCRKAGRSIWPPAGAPNAQGLQTSGLREVVLVKQVVEAVQRVEKWRDAVVFAARGVHHVVLGRGARRENTGGADFLARPAGSADTTLPIHHVERDSPAKK